MLGFIFLLIHRLSPSLHWFGIKVELLHSQGVKVAGGSGTLRSGLLEKEKLATAGGCFKEEMCFTLPERFLHLIRVGRCEDG